MGRDVKGCEGMGRDGNGWEGIFVFCFYIILQYRKYASSGVETGKVSINHNFFGQED